MYISRIAADGREQLTGDHLHETAVYASMLGSKFNLSALVRTAAFFHDMGKFSDEFIQYLRLSVQSKKDSRNALRRGSVIHATQGAKYIYNAGLSEKELLLTAEIIAICIAGHHGGLMDSISPQGEASFRNRISTDKDALHYDTVTAAFEKEGVLTNNLAELMSACSIEISSFINVCKNEKLNVAFMVHLLVKTVFSCLVDCDRYNAYCFEIGKTPEARLVIPPWAEYALRLENYLSTFLIDSEIACIRQDISSKCLNASARLRGVYRLSVPTGGGKTLSSLRFALNHAKENDMERIIYVIPYLSVLDQTAKEIKRALQFHNNEDFILEHHSNLVPPDDENEAQTYRLMTDRWSQPIIITTMVQFLESIYSHKAGNLRKLHNMANAVLIFDEVQSLPVKCVHLFNDALNYLHTFGNCTVLLCTATQPLIDKVERPVRLSSPPELIADTSEAFDKLKRTHLVDSTVRGGYTTEALRDFVLEKMDAVGNCLVILNTKRDAAKLYRAVKNYLDENPETQIKLLHLSTLMCPAHRMEVINSMQVTEDNKKILKRERILCISTQLIEAGVDISFACVVRALAGLDSIAQAAGRCNRHGENLGSRDVYIVNFEDENLSKLPDIQCGSDVTKRILNEAPDDLQSQNVMERYYREYFYKRKDVMDYQCNNGFIYDLLSNNKKSCGAYINSGSKGPFPALRQAFQTAGEQFCVIDKGTTGVLVPYKRGAELVEEYRTADLGIKSKLLREMGRYSVSLYAHQICALDKEQALHLIEDEIFVLNEKYYDLKLGVVFQKDLEFLCT